MLSKNRKYHDLKIAYEVKSNVSSCGTYKPIKGIQLTKVNRHPSESFLYKTFHFSACNLAIVYLYKEIKFKPNP